MQGLDGIREQNFSVVRKVPNEQFFADKKDGLASLTYEEATTLKKGDRVLSALDDPDYHHYTSGKEYVVLCMWANPAAQIVTLKTTNNNTKYAGGKIMELGNYFTITFHHNLSPLKAP